jgi:hypothetical protein
VTLELLHARKQGPFELFSSEIFPGDLIVFVEKNNQKSIFLLHNMEINQICGENLDFFDVIRVQVKNFNKIQNIKKYIFKIYDKINLIDLINNKNDFELFEHYLMSYLLCVKNEQKFETKKTRSLIFKSFKDIRLCEKINTLILKDPFIDYEDDTIQLSLNFLNLTVQIIND